MAALFEILGFALIANDDRLDLGDLMILDFQTKRNNDRFVSLPHRAEEADLPRLYVLHMELVGSPPGSGIPQPVTEIKPLTVFGEFDRRSHGQAGGIIRRKSIEILIDQSVQTCAIATAFAPVQPVSQRTVRP